MRHPPRRARPVRRLGTRRHLWKTKWKFIILDVRGVLSSPAPDGQRIRRGTAGEENTAGGGEHRGRKEERKRRGRRRREGYERERREREIERERCKV